MLELIGSCEVSFGSQFVFHTSVGFTPVPIKHRVFAHKLNRLVIIGNCQAVPLLAAVSLAPLVVGKCRCRIRRSYVPGEWVRAAMKPNRIAVIGDRLVV